MKHTLPLIAVISLLCLSASARTFTSTDGKTLEADVVSATNESVIIKLTQTGRQFTLPLERLSKADQEFVAMWREEALKNKIPKLEVKVNTGKSDRSDRNDDYDDRLGSFQFTIEIENDELHYSLEGGQANLIVFGESCENDDRYCIMQKNNFKVDLEDGGTFEWQGDEMAYKFDNRTPTLWGYEYYGYLFQLKNSSGKVLYQKITPSKFEWGVDKILEFKPKVAFDKQFKTHGNATIYTR